MCAEFLRYALQDPASIEKARTDWRGLHSKDRVKAYSSIPVIVAVPPPPVESVYLDVSPTAVPCDSNVAQRSPASGTAAQSVSVSSSQV